MRKRLRPEKLILKVYGEQVEKRKRDFKTKRIHLTHPQRILEALIKCLPTEMILGALEKTGFESTADFRKVINDLKKIAERRDK